MEAGEQEEERRTRRSTSRPGRWTSAGTSSPSSCSFLPSSEEFRMSGAANRTGDEITPEMIEQALERLGGGRVRFGPRPGPGGRQHAGQQHA